MSEEDGSGKNAAQSETASSSRRPRRRMTMVLNDDGMQELAMDNDGQVTRPGGDQRRHLAYIRCNN
jgi:hypothetical protein